jgi:molecular chaperone GrpE (heat shock protein)
MSEAPVPKLAKWPFFLGDVLMVSAAVAVVALSQRPLGLWPALFCVASAGCGCWLAVIPFLAEYRAALKLGESANLVDALSQIIRIEAVAGQVAGATSQWQGVHEHAGKAIEAARAISDRMASETREFRVFLEKSNDAEKSHLRLEVEKLRRSEGEWLQILVRMLDNTFALFQAATRSKQPPLIEQIGQFQNIARDTARRVGLVPFAPEAADLFDENLHEPADGKERPAAGARVGEVIATGYTFQGRLVRKSLVTIATAAPEKVAASDVGEEPSANDGAEGDGEGHSPETEEAAKNQDAEAALPNGAEAEEASDPARSAEGQAMLL